ncbi:MAG: hypothetical protein HQ462_05155 [Deltaproteobacteria bacterium]|nr:hypothetical protein [Deltaproteobacteria bacterium]
MLKFTRSAEWIGVDPQTCMQVPVQLKINQGKAEFGGADGSEPAEASVIKAEKGLGFALKKERGIAESIQCATVEGYSAKLKGKTYQIILTANYIGDDDADCKTKGLLPVTVQLGKKIESTWKENFCNLPRHGLASGDMRVNWAGDLDGDGKLDLLLRLPSHPMAATYLLPLSTHTNDHRIFSFSRPGNPGC